MLKAAAGQGAEKPAEAAVGLHGLAVIVRQKIQVSAVHGDGDLQLLGEKGGILYMVHVAVGENNEPDIPLPAQGKQFFPIASPSGVNQNGPLFPLDEMAVYIAAMDLLDSAHVSTP